MSSVIGSAAAASSIAVGRTLALCVVGFVLARYRANAGGAATWRDVAKINAEFFTPCLVLAAFPKGVSPSVLGEFWPVILLAVGLPCVWLLVGALGGWLLLPSDQRHFIRFCAVTVAYPNAFAMTYPLLMALARQVDWLRDGKEDPDAFSASVTMLFSLVLLLQVWTVAFGLYGSEAATTAAPPSDAKANSAIGRLGKAAADIAKATDVAEAASSRHDDDARAEKAEQGISSGDGAMAGAVPSSLPDARPPARRSTSSLVGALVSGAGGGGAGAARAIKEIVNPLLVSLLLALLISLSPLREPFIDSVLFEVVDLVGKVAVPLTLVQMGAGMARPPALKEGSSELRWRSALVVVFLRLIVANLVGSAIVAGCRHAGLLQDPHLALIMYLMCCSPTAANVALVSSVRQAYVQPTGLVLFFMHIAAIPTMLVSIATYVALLS